MCKYVLRKKGLGLKIVRRERHACDFRKLGGRDCAETRQRWPRYPPPVSAITHVGMLRIVRHAVEFSV